MKRVLNLIAFLPFGLGLVACGTAVDLPENDPGTTLSATDDAIPPVTQNNPEVTCVDPMDCLHAIPQIGQVSAVDDLELQQP